MQSQLCSVAKKREELRIGGHGEKGLSWILRKGLRKRQEVGGVAQGHLLSSVVWPNTVAGALCGQVPLSLLKAWRGSSALSGLRS